VALQVFCSRADPATELPPRGLFGPALRRLVPHIYTEAKLSALLDARNSLAPEHGLRPATCRCVFGLLAACGLRISEALALTYTDVDLETCILGIRECQIPPTTSGVVASECDESVEQVCQLA
jgi:integrase/recombinase XerD